MSGLHVYFSSRADFHCSSSLSCCCFSWGNHCHNPQQVSVLPGVCAPDSLKHACHIAAQVTDLVTWSLSFRLPLYSRISDKRLGTLVALHDPLPWPPSSPFPLSLLPVTRSCRPFAFIPLACEHTVPSAKNNFSCLSCQVSFYPPLRLSSSLSKVVEERCHHSIHSLKTTETSRRTGTETWILSLMDSNVCAPGSQRVKLLGEESMTQQSGLRAQPLSCY